MAPKRNPTALLEETVKALAATEAEIVAAKANRAAELAGAADSAALDKLDSSIVALETAAARHRERITLLQAECKQELIERQERERQALIDRIDARLAKRDGAVAELQDVIGRAVVLFHSIIRMGHDVDAAWPWHAADRIGVMTTGGAVLQAVQWELFRAGAQPMPLGGQKPSGLPGFPGGRCPNLELLNQPEKVAPLVDLFKDASAYGSKIMREGHSHAPSLRHVNGVERTPGQARLAKLLAQQVELAKDTTPNGEAKYGDLMREIAEAQTVVQTGG